MKMKRLVHTPSSSSLSAAPAHRSWRSSSAGTGQSALSAPGAGWWRTGLNTRRECRGWTCHAGWSPGLGESPRMVCSVLPPPGGASPGAWASEASRRPVAVWWWLSLLPPADPARVALLPRPPFLALPFRLLVTPRGWPLVPLPGPLSSAPAAVPGTVVGLSWADAGHCSGRSRGPERSPLLSPCSEGPACPCSSGSAWSGPAVPLRWFFRAGLGLLLFVWLWWVLVC